MGHYKMGNYIRSKINNDEVLRLLTETNLTIKAIANNVGVKDLKWFHILFKERNGITPNEFRNRVKIELAQKLLTDTNRNIYLIGIELGHKGMNSFTVFFKRHTGMTPTEFRKQIKKIVPTADTPPTTVLIMKRATPYSPEDNLRRIKTLLADTFNSFERIAAQTGFTYENELSRFFRKKTGMSISVYRDEIKISRAQRYLRRTDLTVEQISYNLGFTCDNDFINFFNRLARQSPEEYREQALAAKPKITPTAIPA